MIPLEASFSKPPSSIYQSLFQSLEKCIPESCIGDSIVISGTGRSGSTWLAELVRNIQGYKCTNEPLAHTSLCTRTYIAPKQRAPKFLHPHIEEALKGRGGRSWRWRFQSNNKAGRIAELILNRKVAVKFTRALRITQWMARTFNVCGILLLMRHPCAVISSMLRHGGWSKRHMKWRGESPAQRVLGHNLPKNLKERFLPAVSDISERYETLAHMWALDYHLAFFEQSVSGHPWILVPYERLIVHGKSELHRIMGAIGEVVNSEMEQRMGVASTSASNDLNTENRKNQLKKWKSHLSTKQIERILEIAHLYDIDWYTADGEPTYSKINSLQQNKARW